MRELQRYLNTFDITKNLVDVLLTAQKFAVDLDRALGLEVPEWLEDPGAVRKAPFSIKCLTPKQTSGLLS